MALALQQQSEAGESSPLPLVQVYERLWQNTAYRRYSPGEFYVDAAIEALRPNMGASFIDFGCGTGRPAAELRKRGYGIVGVDFAENCLDAGIDVPFLVADLTKRIALTAQFGFCTDVLEHIPPDLVDDVLLTIADCVKCGAFFSIALDLDEFGPMLAHGPLHLTVKPAKWWREKLGQFFPRIKVVSESDTLVSFTCFHDVSTLRTDVKIEALCNTPDEIIFANVAVNARRSIPWIAVGPVAEMPCIIVGGGPSLAKTLPTIKKAIEFGWTIFALNGAAKFLQENDIRPDWLIVIDSRPQNVEFVKTKPSRGVYLASQCHPSLFDAVGDSAIGFHMAVPGIGDHLPPGTNATLIGGGITSGLTALAVVYTLGYRLIQLHGYDSSDAEDGNAHAYPQDQTLTEKKRLDAVFKGKHYRCSFAMYKQAEEFEKFSRMLADGDAVIDVQGEGLLPAIALDIAERQREAQRDPSYAVYDLAQCPASYDFVGWLVNAEMVRRRANAPGPLKVAFSPGPDDGFRRDLHPMVNRKLFLNHVLRPALGLIGAVEDEAAIERGCWHRAYTLTPVSEAARNGESVPRLRAPESARAEVVSWLAQRAIKKPVVLTLREAKHWPQRNSNMEAWKHLGRDLRERGHEVIFLRDTDQSHYALDDFLTYPAASHDLFLRMALYEEAKCCLFSSNGPAILALFSERPFLVFEFMDVPGYTPATDEWWRKNHGIERGSQFPWCRSDQKFLFGNDSYPAMRAAWDEIEPLLS